MSSRDRLAFLKGVWKEFNDDNGSLMAGAISFFGFLSFFPTILAGVGILGYLLTPENAERILQSTLSHFIVGSQAQAILKQVVNGRGAATGVGLLLLLWSGTSAVVMLEQAMNIAWDSSEQRGFIKTRALALGMLVIGGLLLLVSFGATTALHAVRASSPAILADLGLLWKILGYLVPLLLSIAPFVLVYKFLPCAQVKWPTALFAGLIAGALWEVAKQAFSFYVLRFADYNKVYGSLGSVILLMIWIYYSSTIAVLGAEFGANWSRRSGAQSS